MGMTSLQARATAMTEKQSRGEKQKFLFLITNEKWQKVTWEEVCGAADFFFLTDKNIWDESRKG